MSTLNDTVKEVFNSTLNITNTTVSADSNSTSSWFIPRLLSALTRAILDQANEMSVQQQRSIQTLQEYITSEEVQQQLQDLETNRAILNFNYFVSPYAGVCMIMAILLNRTIVFASSRSTNNTRRKLLPTAVKFLLRSLAIFLLFRMVGELILQFSAYSTSLKVFLIDLNNATSSEPLTKLKIDSLLWEIFLTLCCSQFLETFVSIASGQLPSNDTGLTLFEQSLAFQESQFLQTPPLQLLVIIEFSLVNQLIIQIMGLTNFKRYQLIPSTIMGVSFLIYYIYNIYTGDLVKFPWVVIISIIPQLLVLGITTFCLSIYGLAVWINGSSDGLTYTPMMKNLKDSLNLQMNDDFNSVLMRFGFIIFTAVDNEDYVNEYSSINSTEKTYLDDETGSKSYLLSGYFNKIDNNPDILSRLKIEGPSLSSNENISNSWLLLKKYSNLFKLFQAILQFIIRLFTSKKKRNLTTLPNNLTNPFLNKQPSTSDSFTSIPSTILDDDFIDNSEDFQYESESDLDPLEYDSDIDLEETEHVEYIPTLNALRDQQRPHQHHTINKEPKETPINELIHPKDLIQLINPTNIEDLSHLNSLRIHLLKDERITRSQYAELNQDDLLREVILSNRHKTKHYHEEDIHDKEEFTETPCVVCQTNQRSIILWPCKCFALCETCRVNLGVRGFRICVCCRGNVEGFSKVFIP